MGEEEHVDLPQLVQDFADVLPVEAFPVSPLPVHAISWFARLMVFFSHHAYVLTFLGALVENTILLGFLLPGGAVVALAGAGGRRRSSPCAAHPAGAGMCAGALIDYYLGAPASPGCCTTAGPGGGASAWPCSSSRRNRSCAATGGG